MAPSPIRFGLLTWRPPFRCRPGSSGTAQEILRSKCVACHAGDRAMGGVRFDSRESAIAKSASGHIPMVPGDPAASESIARMRSTDPRRRMPLGQKPLTDAEIAVVEQWITEGASWPANRQQASAPTVHWAYKRLQPVSPPRSTSVATENPIDRFVFSGLDQAKIPQNPRASKETLIRRLSFDLTGLPPSADQVEEYVHDTSPGATEKLIDKLLASPHSGNVGAATGSIWRDMPIAKVMRTTKTR